MLGPAPTFLALFALLLLPCALGATVPPPSGVSTAARPLALAARDACHFECAPADARGNALKHGRVGKAPGTIHCSYRHEKVHLPWGNVCDYDIYGRVSKEKDHGHCPLPIRTC